MGSKKRKESSGAPEEPMKKNKKSKSTDEQTPKAEVEKIAATLSKPENARGVPSDSNPEPTTLDNAAVKSKKSRKRAADFMEHEATDSDGGVEIPQTDPVQPAEEPATKKAKKGKKNKKSKDQESLTADGVNGVIEQTGNEQLEIATQQSPVANSMQAEAERTVDHELKDGFGGFASEDDEDSAEQVEVDDNTAALLAGFDSDTEDKEDEDLDLSTIPTLPKSKKLQKKLDKAKAKADNEGPGTVYVGRIPHGFYEKEMKAYFSQFGDITRLRLSRNKRTGASKHFAFLEFSHDSVAKIAAEAMDNYLMFGHILKCKYAQPGSLHPDVWKGANKKFRKIPHEKLEREQLATPKTEEKWRKKIDKEQKKRDKKAEKMKEIGLDMPASVLANPLVALQQKLADQVEPKQIEEEEVAPTGAIEPPTGVPKDEVAVKASKKAKKEKKGKKGKNDEPEAAVEKEKPAPAATVETLVDVPKDVAAKASKKSKKEKKKSKNGTKDDAEAVSESKTVLELTDSAMESDTRDRSQPQNAEDAAVAEVVAEGPDKASTKRKRLSKAEKKVLAADRRAENKAKKLAEKSTAASELADVDDAAENTPEEIAADTTPDATAELSADFISLGEFNDAPKQTPSGGQKLKPWKVKKPKKERKNLVKARGPKSGLVSTKPKPDPNAIGKIPGLPLMGKGKYNKATRLAHKELKNKIVADRAARGLPPHRVRGE